MTERPGQRTARVSFPAGRLQIYGHSFKPSPEGQHVYTPPCRQHGMHQMRAGRLSGGGRKMFTVGIGDRILIHIQYLLTQDDQTHSAAAEHDTSSPLHHFQFVSCHTWWRTGGCRKANGTKCVSIRTPRWSAVRGVTDAHMTVCNICLQHHLHVWSSSVRANRTRGRHRSLSWEYLEEEMSNRVFAFEIRSIVRTDVQNSRCSRALWTQAFQSNREDNERKIDNLCFTQNFLNKLN